MSLLSIQAEYEEKLHDETTKFDELRNKYEDAEYELSKLRAR